MNKCSICGTEQKEIGKLELSFIGSESKPFTVTQYNIQLLTYIKGKSICDDCMHTYNKIYALFHNVDFSSGSYTYYADGRNLK